jgi:predicted DNA-binding WGR domain protein
MFTIRLINTRGNHYKEYNILQEGCEVELSWGRIGKPAQMRTIVYATERMARQAAYNTGNEKIRKGYVVAPDE